MQQILSIVSHAARALETPNNFSLIVGDREFVERAHRARHEENNIARSHEDDVSSFQAKSRVDDRVGRVERQLVDFDVLVFVTSRRDPDVKTACVMRRLSDDVNDTRRSTG